MQFSFDTAIKQKFGHEIENDIFTLSSNSKKSDRKRFVSKVNDIAMKKPSVEYQTEKYQTLTLLAFSGHRFRTHCFCQI